MFYLSKACFIISHVQRIKLINYCDLNYYVWKYYKLGLHTFMLYFHNRILNEKYNKVAYGKLRRKLKLIRTFEATS